MDVLSAPGVRVLYLIAATPCKGEGYTAPPKRMQTSQLLLRMGLLPGWVGIRHEKYLQQGRVDVQEVVGDVGSQKAGGEVLGPQEIFLLQQPDQVEHTKFLEHGPR